MKHLILTSFLIIVGLINAQSKKEQIEILNKRVDSLNATIGSERSSNQNKITELKSSISNLEVQVKNLSDDVAFISREIQESYSDYIKNQKQIVENKTEISRLQSALKLKSDSLYLIKNISLAYENQKVDTLLWEMDNLYWEQLEFKLKLVLPINKFENPEGNILYSKDKKIKIVFDYNYTHWSDQEEGFPKFKKIQDAIDYYSKDLKNLVINENMGFVINGKNRENELVIIKGIYAEERSMQGREDGEPIWLWSNTITLKATVNEKYIQEYDMITDFLINSFSLDSIEFL
jgi:hypothetical protein